MAEQYELAGDLVIVGLDTEDGKEHPLYDERVFLELDENFVRNVMVYGVQVPVLVRYEGGQKLVVAGRQRVRAAREASRRADTAGEHGFRVPVVKREGDDSRMSGIMISENEIRTGDDVLTKARKATRLLSQLGDINEVAIAFGRSTTQMRNWLKLCQADPAIHAAIRSGKISASAAIAIAVKPREEHGALLQQLLSVAAVGGKPASEGQAKKVNRESGGHKQQAGVKRTWLKRALKTQAALDLTDECREVLTWFANGVASEDSWCRVFEVEANAELENGG